MNRAILGTTIWVVIVVLLASYNLFTDFPGRLNLNELGDFVAGAMSPLAIFWLVMVYLQQRKEMRDQVEQTRDIAIQTQKQVEKMDEQFHKQFEPFLVCLQVGANEVTNNEIEGFILVENIGETARDFRFDSSICDEIKVNFKKFDLAERKAGDRRTNFRDAVYVAKGQQFYIYLNIPFKNDTEKYSEYSINIYYKDMLNRQYQLPINYQLSGDLPKGEVFYGTQKTQFGWNKVFTEPAIKIAPLL